MQGGVTQLIIKTINKYTHQLIHNIEKRCKQIPIQFAVHILKDSGLNDVCYTNTVYCRFADYC